jgi:Flp pilus assembly protein TadD
MSENISRVFVPPVYFVTSRLLTIALVSFIALGSASALSPADESKEVAKARSLAADGRFDDACNTLRGVLSVDKNNVDAHYFLGLVLGRQGKYEPSISHEKAALELDPGNAAAYSILGLSLGSLRQYSDAALALQESIRLQPTAPSSYVNLAAIREKQGENLAACDLYHRALAIDPEYARAYLGLGEALGKLGRKKEQVEACKQAVRFAPKSAMAHAKLGLALSSSGDIGGSIGEGFAANALKVQESWNEFLGTFLAAWGLVFLGFSLIFAVVFAGSRFKPQDGETVLRSFFLTFHKDQPGRFVVTDSRLVFVPEVFSQAFGATRVSIQRAQVESIQYLSTMGSGTVSILTRDKSVHQFRMPLLVLDPLRSFLVSQALTEEPAGSDKSSTPAAASTTAFEPKAINAPYGEAAVVAAKAVLAAEEVEKEKAKAAEAEEVEKARAETEESAAETGNGDDNKA